MVLSLKYGDLSSAASEANKLSKELGQYCDDLSRKVQKKMYSVEGGTSSALSSADYYINQKIKQLRARESNAGTLSSKTQELLDTAKRVDKDVEKTIQANQKAFFKKNPELKSSIFKRAFVSFLCDLKNVPVLGWLIEGGELVMGALDTLKNNIRYWYKCEGGKELVGIVLAAAGAILAVVILVCAFPFTAGATLLATFVSAIVYAAGVVGAIIGVVNAVTNIVTSFQAYEAAANDHPGMAKIYADQNKLSDVIRQTNFHDRDWNRRMNMVADRIEITDAVCSVISLVNGIAKAYEAFKGIDVRKTIDAICKPRDSLGRFVQGKPTFWNGVKSIAMKFDAKDFILGDLNVKDLSRFKLLPTAEKLKAIGSLAKAWNGIVGDLDKINEGTLSFSQFAAKRISIGLDNALLGQMKLKTGDNGIRKYEDTNFTTIVKMFRVPINATGFTKILTDIDKTGSLSYILGTDGGFIESLNTILEQIEMWKKPYVVTDEATGKVTVENWKSNKGYFDGVNIPPKRKLADVLCKVSVPTFVLPEIQFTLDFESKFPYMDVAASAA